MAKKRKLQSTFLVFCGLFAASQASAQTAPDAIFSVLLKNGSVTIGSQAPASSWTETRSSGSGIIRSMAVSGSVSGNSISCTSEANVDGTGATGSFTSTATQEVTVLVKGTPSVEIVTTHSASGSINSNSNDAASVSYSGSLGGSGTMTLTKPFGTTGTSSDSGSGGGTYFVNLGCSGQNGGAATAFTEYPGVVYRPIDLASELAFRGTARTDGPGISNTVNLSVDGTSTVTVTIQTDAPTPQIDGPFVGGVAVANPAVGNSVTMKDISYDTDNRNGTTAGEGICSHEWTLTRPDGSVTSSTAAGNFTFTATMAGVYNVVLEVTDNEGSVSQTDTDVEVSPPEPAAGRDPADCEDIAVSCGDKFVTMLKPCTGNIYVVATDPIQTRGFPLANNLSISSQTRFPSRTTAFGNASFTYGMEVTTGTVKVAGVNETHWFLIDGAGTEVDYGIATSAPTPSAGAYAQLAAVTGGYELTGAGPPDKAYKAGNFSYEFDTSGKLTKVIDPSGNEQEVTYDSYSRPEAVTDLATGREITFEYDTPGGYVSRARENGANVAHYAYSSGTNRLDSITVKDNSANVLRKLQYAYYSDGRVAQISRDNDAATEINFTYVYAGSHFGNGVYYGNMSWSGGSTNLNYFQAPGTGAVYRAVRTNAQSGQVIYDFTSARDIKKMILPTMYGGTAQPTYTFTHDSNHNMTSASDGSSDYDFTYNSLGLLTEVDDNNGGVWTYAYSGVDLTSITDSVHTLRTLAYTDSNNPHSPTTITDGLGKVWTYAYNSHGQVTDVTPPTGGPSSAASLTYEENSSSPNYGYLKQFTNGAGDEVDYANYSLLGNVGSITTHPSSGVTNTTELTYDAIGRVLQIEHPDAKTYEYEYSGRDLVSVLDEAGTLFEFEWCAICGALTGMDYPLSKSLSWSQNSDHQTTGFTDARSNSTIYAYGNAGELKTATYPDSSQIQYRYDDSGRLKRITTPRGRDINYSYDASGRIYQESFPTPWQQTHTFTYNDDGTIASVPHQAGSTSYAYNARKQLTSVSYTFTGLTPVQKLEYTYNDDGSRATMKWKTGTTTVVTWTYSYDGAGRLSQVTNSFGESVSYTYDGEGKITLQTNGNGTSTAYTFNEDRDWPTRIDHKLSGTSFARYDLTYDGGSNTVGNITGVTELNGDTMSYTYDALYRLTEEERTGSNSYTKTYTYDLAGNITDLNGSSFATYDSANKFSSITSGSETEDASGNLTAISGPGITTATYTWETRERLKTQQVGSTTYTYYNDWTGKRVRRTSSSGSTIYYIFDGDQLVGEMDSSPNAAYTWGADGLAVERWLTNNRSLYYHFGPQGETRHLTDGSGTIKNTYLYSAYGLAIASTGTDYNRHRYGGKVGYFTDGPGSSVLMLATHRWYNPELRRWLSRDPIEYEGGDNVYAYVHGRPMSFLDPSGLDVYLGHNPDSKVPGHENVIVGAPTGGHGWTLHPLGIVPDSGVPKYPGDDYYHIPTDEAVDEIVREYIKGLEGPHPYPGLPIPGPAAGQCIEWSRELFHDIWEIVQQSAKYDPKQKRWVRRWRTNAK